MIASLLGPKGTGRCGPLTPSTWPLCTPPLHLRVQVGALSTVALGAVASQPHMVSYKLTAGWRRLISNHDAIH